MPTRRGAVVSKLVLIDRLRLNSELDLLCAPLKCYISATLQISPYGIGREGERKNAKKEKKGEREEKKRQQVEPEKRKRSKGEIDRNSR